MNAVTGDTVRQAEPRAGAASSPAFGTQGDLPTTFKDGLALPVEESVWRASSRTPGDSAAQGLSSDDSVPVVRDLGRSGRNPDTAAALAPVRRSGTPTERRADDDGAAGTEPAAPLADSAPPMAAGPDPVEATVYGGAAAAPSEDTAGVGSLIPVLDRALRASGRDSTASPGQDREVSMVADGAAGPAVPDVRLPEGWNVSGSLGLRRLLYVADPALPEDIPAEMAGSELRVWIRVNPQGLVRVDRWEKNSASMELNNKITEALRHWRYEQVEGHDPVYGMVTIQIHIHIAEVAVSGQ